MNNTAPEKFKAGETIILEADITLDQAAYPITGCLFYFTLRDKPVKAGEDPYDAACLLAKDSSNGVIIVTDGTSNTAAKAKILLDSPDTRNLPTGIPLYSNLRMKNPTDNAINDLADGIITFLPASAQRAYL